jgi:hypothetical protein
MPPQDSGWIRKGLYWPIEKTTAELGNADLPPMFKSFLHVEIEDDSLVIRCYGVTGWRQHSEDAGKVPREDCVRIDLKAAKKVTHQARGEPARSLPERILAMPFEGLLR